MMDLKALAAKQRALRESADAKQETAASASPPVVESQPGTAVAIRPTGIRIGLLAAKASNSGGTDLVSGPSLSAPAEPGRVAINSNLTLAGLAALDTNAIDAEFVQVSGFDDEIPATKPIRTKFEDQSKDEQGFAESLDSLYELLGDVDTFRAVVESIMIELANNPEYRRQIVDEDVHTMIATMRHGMGLARIEKQVAKAKRAPGGSTASKASKSAKAVDEATALLMGLGVSLE